MPLSEHEQRLLEQMERALSAEDPKFASTLRGVRVQRGRRRRLGVAVLFFLLGLGVLLAGVILNAWLVGIFGFVDMLLSSYYVVTSFRHRGVAPSAPTQGGPAPQVAHQRAKFMDRVEERWRRRRDGD